MARALQGSHLEPAIRPGIQAVPAAKRVHIDEGVRAELADSLDLDEATRAQYPRESRWDYLLGHAASAQVIGLEPHSAETSKVSEVIAKRAASLRHIRDHLQPGETVAAWYWAASGRVNFAPFEKTLNRLNQHGIEFVGASLKAKHLAALSKRASGATQRRARSRR